MRTLLLTLALASAFCGCGGGSSSGPDDRDLTLCEAATVEITGDFDLRSLSEVEAALGEVDGCFRLAGSLQIAFVDGMTDLSFLDGLTEVTGDLALIRNDHLTTLGALQSLRQAEPG